MCIATIVNEGIGASPWILILAGSVIGALLVILLRVSRVIRELQIYAQRLARGDLSQRIRVTWPLRLTSLASTLNETAEQLQDRMTAIMRQREELGAVLSSMTEGVVALNLDESVISLNRAAAKLLTIKPGWATGRPIQEVFHNTAMQVFVARTLAENQPLQTEVTIHTNDQDGSANRQLQAQSAILRDPGGERIGVVVVLHDVTELRRLENVRQDFVANVSHELKTPISAITAGVEVLLDDMDQNPEDRLRILRIVERQAVRLGAIVEDLLELARLEQGREQSANEVISARVEPVLTAAREACQALIDAKHIQMKLLCPATLQAKMNPVLLERAMMNLIENAVKYSDDGSQVSIKAEQTKDEVVLAVIDQGCGIESEHLTRIFERFYRTDKARSRERGGTGLGLSIVKHAAEAQLGRATVQSTPGVGSTFRIHLQSV